MQFPTARITSEGFLLKYAFKEHVPLKLAPELVLTKSSSESQKLCLLLHAATVPSHCTFNLHTFNDFFAL